MIVRQISYKDTLSIRHQMLRPGKKHETCFFPGDDDENTFHLGAFVNSKLVSVASFYFSQNDNLPQENQYQLRGMATLPEFQSKGFSRELLKFGFPLIQRNLCQIVWCNARSSAIGFYKKTGFEEIGDEFEIPTVGPHRLMYLKLKT